MKLRHVRTVLAAVAAWGGLGLIGCQDRGSSSGPAAGPASGPPVRPAGRFIGKVEAALPLAAFEGPALRADVDPKFVVRIRVVQTLGGSECPSKGLLVDYAIHSCVKTFGLPAEQLPGRQFRFEVARAEAAGGGPVRYILTPGPMEE